MISDVLVTADNLVKSFRTRPSVFGSATDARAVNGISLQIHKGETLALVGESGCGKSTTGRLMLGLEKPDTGTVTFDGAVLPAPHSLDWRHLRSQMQMVFQDPMSSLDRRMPIKDQLREPLDLHKVVPSRGRQQRVSELLQSVGLDVSHGDRLPHELSGGQRQRAVLARALATEPKFIVCDEPLSALDVLTQRKVMQLLRQLQEQLGTTFLLISHDLRAVRKISHRVAVMYLGNIVEIGPTVDVFRDPHHPYTRALISSIPTLNGLRHDRIILGGDPPNPSSRPSGCSFHPRCPMATERCRTSTPRLENVLGSHSKAACFYASKVSGASGEVA